MADNFIDLTASSDEEPPASREARARRHERMLTSIARLRLHTADEINARYGTDAGPSIPYDRLELSPPPSPRNATPSAKKKTAEPLPPTNSGSLSSHEPSHESSGPAAPLSGADDLYWAWHGSAACYQSSDATRGDSACSTRANEAFDWFGVRKRAKRCRDRIDSAAEEDDLEDKRPVPAEKPGVPADDQADTPKAAPFDIMRVMKQLKSCLVEVTANGVTFKEYRPLWAQKKPDRYDASESAKSHASEPAKRPATSKKKSAPKARTLSNPPQILRPTSRAKHPPLAFVEKAWSAKLIHLRASYNPQDTKFAFETPFAGICDYPSACVKNSCPNGILNIFCTEECCDYKGKCFNSRHPHDDPRIACRRGSNELAVITVDSIEAGVVLGEYVGEIKIEPKPLKPTDKPVVNNGYLYKVKRQSESHPTHTVYIDAKKMGGITRFMNHSCNASAVFEEVRNGSQHSVVVVTQRALRAGEEVTFFYGTNLWFTCRCGEPSCQHRDVQDMQHP